MSRKVIGVRAEEIRDQDQPNHGGLKRKATEPISEALAKLGIILRRRNLESGPSSTRALSCTKEAPRKRPRTQYL
jgi:hypothetical protein